MSHPKHAETSRNANMPSILITRAHMQTDTTRCHAQPPPPPPPSTALPLSFLVPICLVLAHVLMLLERLRAVSWIRRAMNMLTSEERRMGFQGLLGTPHDQCFCSCLSVPCQLNEIPCWARFSKIWGFFMHTKRRSGGFVNFLVNKYSVNTSQHF